ncbi:MAG: 50S ribosomal protein L21 [Bdellovibrionaceae bacterium]|nr:50S ribosomal protein L21 [Pseudobdellovibrionaceae bacterium]
MYAVIKTGGKQYKVQAGESVWVEKIESDTGKSCNFEALLVSAKGEVFVGSPTVKDASVSAEVRRHFKAPKILVFKKKRRQGYRRLNGHRQPMTELFIKEITSPNGEVAKAAKKAKKTA